MNISGFGLSKVLVILALVRVFLLPASLSNLGLAVFNILVLAILWSYHPVKEKNTKTLTNVVFGLGIAISIFFGITTNPLVVNINNLVVNLVIVWGILGRYLNSNYPNTVLGFIPAGLRYILDLIRFIFSRSSIQRFTKEAINLTVSWLWLGKIVITIIILLVFHSLFAQVNSDYQKFTQPFFDYLWKLLENIIDTIGKLLWSIILSYIYFGMVNAEQTSSTRQLSWPKVILSSLGAVIILFLVFSVFQGKLLFVNLWTLPFKELSVYTQKGFWELLVVAGLGHLLFLACVPFVAPTNRVRQLLTIFSVELLGIVIFTYHKLFSLQYFFGFKDQRILATIATTLILGTFILHFGRLWRGLASSKMLQLQIVGLLISVFIINLINIDLLSTRINPISYYSGDKKVKDYSYLLGNSYDNYSMWIWLINELKGAPLPEPNSEYYWGYYKPICQDWNLYRDSIYRDQNVHPDLTTKYEKFWNKDVPQMMEFNYHEYMAFRLIEKDKETFQSLTKYLGENCKSNKTR